MALTICNPISRCCFRLTTDWKLKNLPNGKEISVVPFRKRGVPLQVLHNFRTEFPKNYLTIWLQTEISRFFGQMVSTLYLSVNYLSSGTYWPIRYSVAGLTVSLKTVRRACRRFFLVSPSSPLGHTTLSLPSSIHGQRHLRSQWLNARPNDPQRKNRLPVD